MKKILSTAIAGILCVGLTGAADAKGPKGGIDIFNLCTLDTSVPGEAWLSVDTTITDASNDDPDTSAILGSKTVKAIEKRRRNQRITLAEVVVDPAGAVNPVTIELCAAGLSSDARAVNAMVTVEVENGRDASSRL